MKRPTEKLGLKELVAMGVGGMVGGGIFSVLGLSAVLAGHAAPVAFAIGGFIALLTGVSYAHLGVSFKSDGGSFTYFEYAFHNRNVAGIGGWLLVCGYMGTLALYAYTFGAYGSAMLGLGRESLILHIFASGILLVFLGINLYGVRAAGGTEDIIVAVKVLILLVFCGAGLFSLKAGNLKPFFNRDAENLLMGAALVFVAYEGFELIPNAVNETRNPAHDLPRSIIISIGITTLLYILVSLVAVGNLTSADIQKYKEYALAVAARPALGKRGFMLISLGALLSTASAINATLFGTARLGKVMATEESLPRVFSHSERTRDVPWVSLVVITLFTMAFVNTGNLTVISSFASSTFLLIFAGVNMAAWKLRKRVKVNAFASLLGFLLALVSWGVLMMYLWRSDRQSLLWIGVSYSAIALAEFLFSERRVVLSR